MNGGKLPHNNNVFISLWMIFVGLQTPKECVRY
jgi:hypothetical protein